MLPSLAVGPGLASSPPHGAIQLHPGAGWAMGGHGHVPRLAQRRDIGPFPAHVTGLWCRWRCPEGGSWRPGALPPRHQPLPGPPGAAWRQGNTGCGDVDTVLVPSCGATGMGLDRSAGGTEAATGRRNVPLHIPVSQGPRHLCRRLPPLSHGGDSEVAGEGGHSHAWAQRWGIARSSMEGFGVLKGSSRAVSPCPHPAQREGVPAGWLPVPLSPSRLPPARRLAGGASRGLYALLAHFLPSVSNSSWRLLLPAFFQLKKKNPRHLLSVRLPEAGALPCPAPAAGAARGGDSGCPRCPASLLVPFYVGHRIGDRPATSLCPGVTNP
ncbi:cdc42 effector protein 4 isoform X1 [Chroicocephalus ridibundus]|uniref:cdc42 effector protein 4 isoform X1 n=1 Tax=Chroicocephalus ridibundus TaxID=1192867 RepID=UPI002FDDA9DA